MQCLMVFVWQLLEDQKAELASWMNSEAQIAAAEITEEAKKKGTGNRKQRATGSKAQAEALFKN